MWKKLRGKKAKSGWAEAELLASPEETGPTGAESGSQASRPGSEADPARVSAAGSGAAEAVSGSVRSGRSGQSFGGRDSGGSTGSTHRSADDFADPPIGGIRTLQCGVQGEDDIAPLHELPDGPEQPPGEPVAAFPASMVRPPDHLPQDDAGGSSVGGSKARWAACFGCCARRRRHSAAEEAQSSFHDTHSDGGDYAHESSIDVHAAPPKPRRALCAGCLCCRRRRRHEEFGEQPVYVDEQGRISDSAGYASDAVNVAPSSSQEHPPGSQSGAELAVQDGTQTPPRRRRLPAAKGAQAVFIALSPLCCILALILVPLILLITAWSNQEILYTEGAFGLITQVDSMHAVGYASFSEAFKLSTTTSALEEGERLSLDTDGYTWKRLQIVIPLASTEVTKGDVSTVLSVNSVLVGLPGWSSLCAAGPADAQELCSPGYTLSAINYGERSTPTDARSALGVSSEIDYNGASSSQILPADVLMDFLPDQHPLHFSYLLETYGDGAMVMKSTYQFLLPSSDARDRWRTFLYDEALPELDSFAKTGTLYYRGDDLDDLSTSRAMERDRPFMVLPVIILFFGTWLLSGRLLLALATSFATLLGGGSSTTFTARAAYFNQPVDTVPGMAFAGAFAAAMMAPTLTVSLATYMERTRRRNKLDSWVFQRCAGLILGPTIIFSGMFFTFIFITKALLVREFALPAAFGVLFMMLFAVALTIPAVIAGDRIPEQFPQIPRARRRVINLVRKQLHIPQGSVNQWMNLAAGAPAGWTRILARPSSACMAAVLVLCLLIVLMVQVLSGGISWRLSATPFYMWAEGHFRRDQVPIFDAVVPLPTPTTSPVRPLLTDVECQDVVSGAVDCGWHTCTDTLEEEAVADSCLCYAKSGTATAGCPFQARVWGLAANQSNTEFFSNTFWPELTALLSGSFSQDLSGRENNITSESPMVLEEWQSGTMVLQDQIQVTSINDTSITEPCIEALCYCGSLVCQVSDADYTQLARFQTARRLESVDIHSPRVTDEKWTEASHRIREFRQRPRRLTEEDAAPAGTETINVIWGVDRPQDPPARDYSSDLYLEAFEVDEPWMQRNIYAVCAGTSPDLGIVSRSCWILDFKTWLESNGWRFPVEQGSFYEAFDLWLADASSASFQQFWFEDGVMKGTFITFYVEAPTVDDRPALDDFIMRWQSYVWRRNIIARDQDLYSPVRLNPAEAWISSALFAEMIERDALEDAMLWPSVVVFLFTLVGTLLLSCNCGMMCAVMITLVVASCFFALLEWLIIGSDITWREATMLVTFMPCFAMTLLRFVVAYTCSQAEIPPLHPPRRARIAGGSKRNRRKKGPVPPPLICSMPPQNGVHGNADVQKKRAPQLWLGRVMKERKARIAVVLGGEGKALLSFAFVGAVGGLSLVSGETSGLEGVGLGLLASSVGCLVFTLGLLPVLLLCGFGPTLTRRVAFLQMKDYLRPSKQRDDEDRSSDAESQSEPEEQKNRAQHVQLTAQVLGLPFTMMVPPVEAPAAKLAAAGNAMGDSPRLDLTEINGARAMQNNSAFMAIAYPSQLALPPLLLGAPGDRSLETTTSPATGLSLGASTEGSLSGIADQVIVEH